MVVSSFAIIYEAINNLKHPHELKQLNYGIYLVALKGVINYVVRHFSIKNEKKSISLDNK